MLECHPMTIVLALLLALTSRGHCPFAAAAAAAVHLLLVAVVLLLVPYHRLDVQKVHVELKT